MQHAVPEYHVRSYVIVKIKEFSENGCKFLILPTELSGILQRIAKMYRSLTCTGIKDTEMQWITTQPLTFFVKLTS